MNRILFWISVMAAVSLAIRVDLAHLLPNPLATDSAFYDASAQGLVRGHGFSVWRDDQWQPLYAYTPGYSLMVAGVMWLTSDVGELGQTTERVRVLLVVQMVMFYITGFLVWWLGKNRFGLRGVWLLVLSGWLLFDIPRMMLAGLILSESLAGLIVAVLLVGVNWAYRRANHWWWWLGILSGWLTLIKPFYVYVVLAVMVWLILERVKKKYVGQMLLFGLGFCLVLTAWEVRTYMVSNMWVPIQAGGRFVVSTGMCPQTLCNTPLITQQSTVIPAEEPIHWLRTGWWHTVHKYRELFGQPEGWMRLQSVDNPSCRLCWTGLIWMMHIGRWVFFFPGAIGLWQQRRMGRLLLLVLMSASLVHGLLWSQPRYAVILAPLVSIVSVFGLKSVWYWRFREAQRMIWPWGVLLVMWWLIGYGWWLPRQSGLSLASGVIGVLWLAGGTDLYLRLAVRGKKNFGSLWWSLGLCLWMVLVMIAIVPVFTQQIIGRRFRWEQQVWPVVLHEKGETVK